MKTAVIKAILIGAAMTLLPVGCASQHSASPPYREPFARLKRGMSGTEVKDLLGDPSKTLPTSESASGDYYLVWAYDYPGIGTSREHFQVIFHKTDSGWRTTAFIAPEQAPLHRQFWDLFYMS